MNGDSPVLLEQLHASTGQTTNAAAGVVKHTKKRSTRYEISVASGDEHAPAWQPVGVVDASSAKGAIREWYEEHDDDHPPPVGVRAVPVTNITQVTVEYKTHRQLSIS